MVTPIAVTVGFLSVLTFTLQLGNFYGKASEHSSNPLSLNKAETMQLFQTPPPPCDPVNDPSSCRSS